MKSYGEHCQSSARSNWCFSSESLDRGVKALSVILRIPTSPKEATYFESLCASGELPANEVRTAAGVSAGRFSGRLVTTNYFEVLGVSPAIGRLFHAGEREPVCVLSYTFWERQWDRNPAVLGTVLSVNEVNMNIVGVTRPGFFGDVIGRVPDICLPMEMQPVLSPGFNWLESPPQLLADGAGTASTRMDPKGC